MGKRTKVFGLIWLLAVGVVLIAVLRWHHEPSYGGHSLSTWVVRYGSSVERFRFGFSESPYNEGAANAIFQIGTNAIPFLLSWMTNPPPVKSEAHDKVNRFLGWLSDQFGTEKRWGLSEVERERAEAAYMAFGTLGQRGSNVAPELNRLFSAPRLTTGSYYAGKALALMPGLGLPLVAAALTNHEAIIRTRAVISLQYAGSNALPLVPMLIRILNDPEEPAASDVAAVTLTTLPLQADAVVQPLTKCLYETNPACRAGAARVLGSLGPKAAAAVPALVTVLSDTNEVAHVEALGALQTIAPETLSNEVVFAEAEKAFQSPYPHLRGWAAIAIRPFGSRAAGQVTNLMHCLDDPVPGMRAVSLVTLQGLGQDARPAIPKILGLLNDSALVVRGRATNALAEIAPELLTNVPPR